MTEFWKRFCEIQRYAFFRGDDCVNKVPFSTGNHIEVGAAEELVDEMDQEISTLRLQLEQAEARVAALSESLREMTDEMDSGDIPGEGMPWHTKAKQALSGGGAAFVLRKQAEALEAEADEWTDTELTYSGRRVHRELLETAERLRNQAAEDEKGG